MSGAMLLPKEWRDLAKSIPPFASTNSYKEGQQPRWFFIHNSFYQFSPPNSRLLSLIPSSSHPFILASSSYFQASTLSLLLLNYNSSFWGRIHLLGLIFLGWWWLEIFFLLIYLMIYGDYVMSYNWFNKRLRSLHWSLHRKHKKSIEISRVSVLSNCTDSHPAIRN